MTDTTPLPDEARADALDLPRVSPDRQFFWDSGRWQVFPGPQRLTAILTAMIPALIGALVGSVGSLFIYLQAHDTTEAARQEHAYDVQRAAYSSYFTQVSSVRESFVSMGQARIAGVPVDRSSIQDAYASLVRVEADVYLVAPHGVRKVASAIDAAYKAWRDDLEHTPSFTTLRGHISEADAALVTFVTAAREAVGSS